MSIFNFISPKAIYLFCVFINMLMISMVKYVGIKGVLTIPKVICFRTTFTFLLLLPFNIKEFSKVRTDGIIDKKTILYLLILGAIDRISSYFWSISLQTVPLNNAMILLFISPILTAVISYLILGEENTKQNKLSFTINLFAIFLIYSFAFNDLNVGYLLLLADFLIYAFIMILIKKLQAFSASLLVFIRLTILLPFS